jgi:aspartyl-tRNA(Asn)/glutamyl-tRNA(Gln) amidotransferase subunit B
MRWKVAIGLEVHVQLKIASKIFSGAASAYGAPANTQVSYVDLALPGVLPVLNRAAVDMALRFGLAIGAEIPAVSVFARKNYFYPDLPKGYQISQYEQPIVSKGTLPIILDDGKVKPITIYRAHLEEDAGKLMHANTQKCTEIDLNRAGVALLEIVSAPELTSAEEAVVYLKTLHSLVKYLGISDANMQEGCFRCDANVSVCPHDSLVLGTRVELKNINSFKFVEQAINYEIGRHIACLERGEAIMQETRTFLPKQQLTKPLRSKEEAMDYRYFPDPDLLPVHIDAQWLATIRQTLPELPMARWQRFQDAYGLDANVATLLVQTPEVAAFFEKTVALTAQPSLSAHWITGELFAGLNNAGLDISQSPIQPETLAALILRLADQTISGKAAKQIFFQLWETDGEQNVDAIIKAQGLEQVTDVAWLSTLVEQTIARYPEQVAAYQAGKEKILGFLVGQVLQQSKGKASPEQVSRLLQEKLKPN